MSLAESIRQRLLNLAHKKAEPFDLTLTRYGLERLLYRIGQSKWKSNFLLKGAMLFSLWYDSPRRPTKDLDLRRRFRPVPFFFGIRPPEPTGIVL